MATELPATTIVTPALQTTVVPVIKRSWKGRLLIVADGLVAFVLALLDYVGAIKLTDFGITPERAVFYMAVLNLLKFLLLQYNAVKLLGVESRPASGGPN